jgi:hypothetical protein
VAAAAIGALPLSVAAPAFATTGSRVTGGHKTSTPLTRSTFTPLQGSTFRLKGEGRSYDVVLSEINDISTSSGPGDETRFSLVFSGSKDQPRLQGIRTFHNDRVGDVSMFVVPVDRGRKALRLESVFNSL